MIIKDEVDLANESNSLTKVFNSLVVSSTAPKVKAEMTSQMVFNMLDIPPLDNRSSTTGTPLSIAKPECRAVHTPEILNKELIEYVNKKFEDCGVSQVDNIYLDTFATKSEYFSHRRAKKLGENDYGRCISVIKKISSQN